MIDPTIEAGYHVQKSSRLMDGRRTPEAPREILSRMKAGILAEAFGKSLPDSLKAPEDSGDEADLAREERSRDLSLLLTSRSKQKLQAFEDALKKVEEGTYGICEECDEPIGPGRLKAMPLAKLCVACQSTLEKEPKPPRTQEGLLFSDEEG